MSDFPVTRAHLRQACLARNADLLDRLLELDAGGIDDARLFTDSWGLWWGLLVEAVNAGWPDGVRVLLKHGADREATSWGDGLPQSARQLASAQPEIRALLDDPARPRYLRRTEPELPAVLSPEDEAINRQGEVAARAGLVFPLPLPTTPPPSA